MGQSGSRATRGNCSSGETAVCEPLGGPAAAAAGLASRPRPPGALALRDGFVVAPARHRCCPRSFLFELARLHGSSFQTYRIVLLADNDEILRAVVRLAFNAKAPLAPRVSATRRSVCLQSRCSSVAAPQGRATRRTMPCPRYPVSARCGFACPSPPAARRERAGRTLGTLRSRKPPRARNWSISRRRGECTSQPARADLSRSIAHAACPSGHGSGLPGTGEPGASTPWAS